MGGASGSGGRSAEGKLRLVTLANISCPLPGFVAGQSDSSCHVTVSLALCAMRALFMHR